MSKPEEIVALIGNIANRPDIREVQERQVKEIREYVASILEQEAEYLEYWWKDAGGKSLAKVLNDRAEKIREGDE